MTNNLDNPAVILAKRPEGLPEPDDFRLETRSLGPRSSGQIRCQTLYLSLDPYMRSVIAGNHMGHGVDPGEVIAGEVVARVVESDDDDWPIDTVVRCQSGWQTLSDHPAEALSRVPASLSRPSLVLSILGMPGLTAWAGMVDLAKVRDGDVVVIPAAVGGVGAMAAQLCKRAGATTIAITSGEAKRRIALETLGYDYCIDRVEEDLAESLTRIAPGGVSVYFDLVGDPTLTTVAQQLSIGGRVVLCGLIKDYNGDHKTTGPHPGLWITKRATVSGLVVYDYESQRTAFEDEFVPLAESGDLVANEEMHDGLATAPDAFCELMRGRNHGKVVVKVGD
ncbi:MAG: NADP-dependent oxidoreductase [Proteobacteria bacterium]|nr:NADP-dependent oxidoreductase [Luminiphilus sp.]MDA0650650.1 NADP-dependent oxidoreductase [Pseudomonadota bacterium]